MHVTKIPIILTLFFIAAHSFTPSILKTCHSLSHKVPRQINSVLFSRKVRRTYLFPFFPAGHFIILDFGWNRHLTFFSSSRQPEEPNPREMYGYSQPGNSEEEIEAALKDFKQQSQIKAFGVLTVAFSSFVYLKLQYDADPSSFLGSH